MVGGGAVGTRKALTLHAAGASVRVISPEVTNELAEVARAGDRVTLDLRCYEGMNDIGNAQIVIAATTSPDVNALVARDAHTMRRLVNVADAPEWGSFVSMAVHRAGELTIGVGAGSVPSAAARVRDRIATQFGERYAAAISDCASLRSEILRRGGPAEWASVNRCLIGADFCDRVETATFSEEIAACRS